MNAGGVCALSPIRTCSSSVMDAPFQWTDEGDYPIDRLWSQISWSDCYVCVTLLTNGVAFGCPGSSRIQRSQAASIGKGCNNPVDGGLQNNLATRPMSSET